MVSRPPLSASTVRSSRIILNVYGKKVAAGEWRDYALDMLRERAMFSIYQRASERPLYVVEKNPKLARKQGQYMVIGSDGRILKRGHELASRVAHPRSPALRGALDNRPRLAQNKRAAECSAAFSCRFVPDVGAPRGKGLAIRDCRTGAAAS